MYELKRIKDYPNYFVSEEGLVFSLNTLKCLCPFSNHGYLHVSLMRDGKRKSMAIHRCVLGTFKGFKKNKVCNHLDGNKLNNRLCNLEWCTCKENSVHASKNHLLNIVNKKKVCLTSIDNVNVHYVFDSILEAAHTLGIFDSAIHKVLKGIDKHTHGLVFKRIN